MFSSSGFGFAAICGYVGDSRIVADTTVSARIFAKSHDVVLQINYDPFEDFFHCKQYDVLSR